MTAKNSSRIEPALDSYRMVGKVIVNTAHLRICILFAVTMLSSRVSAADVVTQRNEKAELLQTKNLLRRPSMRNTRTWPSARYLGFRTIVVISLALALCGVAKAQNPVIDWNAIAVTTAVNGNQRIPPGSNTAGGTSLYLAHMHLAIYEAV